jgi:PII-like signaling protein
VSEPCVKLTIYLGERDRADGRFAADALLDCFARRELRASVLLRGALGFGLRHHLRTDRLLTLSEDLPVVAVAVDTPDRIEAALPDVESLTAKGLVTLERARLARTELAAVAAGPDAAEAKLTVYLGRGHRLAGRPAFRAVVDVLRLHGVAGASVLLGVDGTFHGARRRAAFFGGNAEVPLMIFAIGATGPLRRALAALDGMLTDPIVTLEQVRIVKRDGHRISEPHAVRTTDPSGLNVWQKLTVHAGEQARHEGRPLYQELVRRLREADAAGATCVRGIWGYHGGHPPHGDRLLAVRRHVPVVTAIIDTPDRIHDLYPMVDELTRETGLVTSELVPAFRAVAGGAERGGLRLADPPRGG